MASELPFLCSDSRETGARPSGIPRSLATARWCAGRGWPVHPLAPGRKTPAGNCASCRESGHTYVACGCPAAGRWCHGFRAATLDSTRIEQWWGAHPGLGVGVACGPAGLVIIDVDAHERQLPDRNRLLPGIGIADGVDLTGLADGFHTIGLLAALRGATSPADDETTLRVRTPSGGLHVWYRGLSWAAVAVFHRVERQPCAGLAGRRTSMRRVHRRPGHADRGRAVRARGWRT